VKLRRLRLIVCVAGLGLVVLIVAVFRVALLRTAGRALVAEDALAHAEVIIVPQWAGNAGALEAAELVRAGLAPRVAVLPYPADPATRELVKRGVLGQETWLAPLIRSLGVVIVEQIPGDADGTEAEGQVLPAWGAQHHVRSMIVVSTPDHSRRVRRVLVRSMRDRAIRLIVHSTRFSEFDPDQWWRTRDGVRTEIIELEKLGLDIIRHPALGPN
jgi:hypothetical protein